MPGIRAAHIVRKDILKVDNSFNGKFSPECQKNSIPASLLSLGGMLIKGPTTKIDPSTNQACVSVSQLIVFNSVARPHHRPEATGSTHHIRSREFPRLDRVRHSFILPQPWKEVCMGCLERLSRVDSSSMRFEGFTRDHHGRITCCLGKVCGTSL